MPYSLLNCNDLLTFARYTGLSAGYELKVLNDYDIMNTRYLRLLLPLLLTFCASTRAALLPDYSPSALQRVSDNTTQCCLRDSYGFMWFGTSNGLNLYDGKSLRQFRDITDGEKSIENNNILSLLEENGKLLMGTISGLYVYDPATNKAQRFDLRTKYNVKISSGVRCMLRCQNGDIWIGTLGQGFFIYSPKKHSLVQNSRNGSFISDIGKDQRGHVFLMSLDGRLNMFGQDGRFICSALIPSYVRDKTQISLQLMGNTAYVGCDMGLFRFNATTRTLEPCTGSGDIGNIQSMATRDGRTILLATTRGLYQFDTQTQTFGLPPMLQTQPFQYRQGPVNLLYCDPLGVLWLVTDNRGVCYAPRYGIPYQFVSITAPAGSDFTEVHAFCQTADGRVWVATTSGLYSYSNGQLQLEACQDMDVQTIVAQGNTVIAGTRHNGLLWIANGKVVKQSTFSPDKPYTLQSNNVTALLFNSRYGLFVGTGWGFNQYDAKQDNFLGFSVLNFMTSFTRLAEDQNHNVWAATGNNGLMRLNPANKDIRIYNFRRNDPHSLPSNSVIDVYCDKQGKVWISTENGFCQYNAEKDNFDRIPTLGERVDYIVGGEQKALWLSTPDGLIYFDTDKGAVALYNDVMPEWIGMQRKNCLYVSRKGEMFVGGEGGFVHFQPQQLLKYHRSYTAMVAGISFPYVTDGHEAEKLGVAGVIYGMQELQLPYRDRSFVLRLASPRNIDALHARYQYKLEGYDQEWVTTNDNTAAYTRLAPGSYTFLLKELGGNEVTRMKIVILPPWYRSTLALCIYIVLLALLVWYIYKLIQRTTRRKYNEAMQAYQTEQQRLTYESKIRFFVNIVHEIRTPLTLIHLPLELLEKNPQGGDTPYYIKVIRRNVDYLIGVVNHFLDFQKIESGKMELHKENCEVGKLLQRIYDQFVEYNRLRGIDLRLELPETEIQTALDMDGMQKVLMNLVGNAQKYARKSIVLSLERLDDSRLRIRVADDGPGITDKNKDRIFDAYYQIKNDAVASAMGTGLGLSFSKAMAEAHGGTLSVEDAPEGGAMFSLVLPIVQQSKAEAKAEAVAQVLPAAQPDESEAEPADRQYTLLFVEDNKELLDVTTQALLPWYKVLKAGNGQEALDVLAHNSVDIIVTDVMMPVMDGVQLCLHVKQNINYSHIPLIMLTAKTSVEAKEEGMAVGADVYVEKPFTIRQLHLQIENIMKSRRLFYDRMHELDQNAPQQSNENTRLPAADYEFLKTLRDLLKAHVSDEDFSIDSIAAEMNMSRSSFYRKLRQLTDMTPVDYVKHYRLDYAAALLRQGKRVGEVMLDVGFTSSSYFAKCFKNQFGVLPKEYV